MNKLVWKLPNNKIIITIKSDNNISNDLFKPDPKAELIPTHLLDEFPIQTSVDHLRYENNKLVLDESFINKEIWGEIRIIRNRLLAESDVLLIRTFEAGGDVEPLKVYRQTLRDVTSYPHPSVIVWPELPPLSLSPPAQPEAEPPVEPAPKQATRKRAPRKTTAKSTSPDTEIPPTS